MEGGKRSEYILVSIKWVSFTFCLFGFLWKTSDSFIQYFSNDIGTKIELKQNYEVDLPAFAICRPQNSFLAENQLENLLKSKVSAKDLDFKYLPIYQKAKKANISMIELLKSSLLNDSEYIQTLLITKLGHYAGYSMPSLVSKPWNDTGNWQSMYHPLYGVCHQFIFDQPLESILGKSAIKFVKIKLNFMNLIKKQQKFGLMQDPRIQGWNMDEIVTEQEEEYDDVIEDTEKFCGILVFVYQKGSFYSTRKRTKVNQKSRQFYQLYQEELDKKQTPSECFNYNEDQCLTNCLVSKFVEELGCLHARLHFIANDSIRSTYPICQYQDLLNQTQKLHQKKLRDFKDFRRLKRSVVGDRLGSNVIEYGLFKIRSLLGNFQHDDVQQVMFNFDSLHDSFVH